MAEGTSPGFQQRYEPLLRAIEAGEHADLVEAAKILRIRGTDRPWTDTGMDLTRGERLSLLAEGRIVLSEELDLWIPPRLYLWRRIGEKGPIFKAPRDTATHAIDRSGRLYLAANPGTWTTPAGDFWGSEHEFGGAPGGYDVLLVRWRGDPAAGLQTLLARDPLGAAELDRLRSPLVAKPRGWEYLWFLGEGEMFSEEASGSIRVCVVNDAAILKKPVNAPLTPETRLRWRWKFQELPSRVAEDSLPSHDYMSIAVEFENGQDLTYYWSAELEPETSFRCPLPWWDQHETHVVLRKGNEGLGDWLAEERPLQADYRKAVGEPPSRIVGVWLIAVSVFSHGRGVAEFADIEIAHGGGSLVIQ